MLGVYSELLQTLHVVHDANFPGACDGQCIHEQARRKRENTLPNCITVYCQSFYLATNHYASELYFIVHFKGGITCTVRKMRLLLQGTAAPFPLSRCNHTGGWTTRCTRTGWQVTTPNLPPTRSTVVQLKAKVHNVSLQTNKYSKSQIFSPLCGLGPSNYIPC